MKKRLAVTIGVFDGVHKGHQYLLQQLEARAAEHCLQAAVVTFDCHPRTIVQKKYAPSLLTTQEEKLTLLSDSFGGEVLVLPFTQELSAMNAKEFMQFVLRDKLNAAFLLMGYNHRFGHDGGSPTEYVAWGKEIGIEVCYAEALAGEKVSSSRIRNLIAEGDIRKAYAMLGYTYFIKGHVKQGKQVGRKIGFPTANICLPDQKLLPANGVYAVIVTLPDQTKHGGMLCIGHRPTVEEKGEISIEVHIFDFNGDLYGETISVGFIEKLRNEEHFDSLEALQRQLRLDAAAAQATICQTV